jgi:acid stress-induced BolA-like protein IbaG/YrbA
METFVQKLKRMLRREFPKCSFDLETGRGDRLSGYLIWKGFSGVEQIERQRTLSAFLKTNLSDDERRHIAGILTMTPEEVAFAKQA